jgi:hypothetical protein
VLIESPHYSVAEKEMIELLLDEKKSERKREGEEGKKKGNPSWPLSPSSGTLLGEKYPN